jgi:hypothetical protein
MLHKKAARDLRPDGLADVVPTVMHRFPSSAPTTLAAIDCQQVDGDGFENTSP